MDREELRSRRVAAVQTLESGLVDDALVELKKLKNEAPEDMLTLSYLGLALAREGKEPERALESCQKAAQIEFFRPECHLNLAKVHLVQGHKPNAVQCGYDGLTVDMEHEELLSMAYTMGVRRPPAFKFLPRSHPVNKWIGKFTWWLSGGDRSQRAA